MPPDYPRVLPSPQTPPPPLVCSSVYLFLFSFLHQSLVFSLSGSSSRVSSPIASLLCDFQVSGFATLFVLGSKEYTAKDFYQILRSITTQPTFARDQCPGNPCWRNSSVKTIAKKAEMVKRSSRVRDKNISAQDESDPEIDLELDDDEEVEDESDPKIEMESEDEDEEDEEDEEDQNEEERDEEDENEEEGDEEELKKLEGQKDAEMEELEKEYLNLREEEQDILKNLKRHKDEDLLKGQAVKNQQALWHKTLEFRILLQKVFSSSNKLPQEPLRSSFCDTRKEINSAYLDLITSSKQTISCLLELQEALLEKNPSIQVTDGNSNNKGSSKDVGSDEEWLPIQHMHSRIASFRDNSLDKWQRKTQVTTGAAGFKGKLHAFNQNISDQVASYMRDPSRMIKRMQSRRSTVGIFGDVPDLADNVKEEDANVDGDPELLDDSEFYQQLLKEFLQSVDPSPSGANTAFYALKRQQTKKRKIVDRRASKNRKIRYHLHEKIVNFMAPQPVKLPPMAPKLFENLFGVKSQKPTTTVE